MTDTDYVAWREIMVPRYAGPLVLACLGVWLHAADSLIVATMMPAIIGSIGGEAYVAWSVALYQLGSILSGVAGGLIVLRHGLRKPMMTAALIFAVGCMISALAPHMPAMLSGRFLQGIGGGLLTAFSFIATARLFPARLSARVMALMSVLWGASAFLGPMIGGIFVEFATWRWGFVFFAAQAFGLAALIRFAVHVEETEIGTETSGRIPVLRLMLVFGGVLSVAAAGIDVAMPRTPLLLALGLAQLVLMVRLDAANPDNRLLPQNPFRITEPVGAALVMMLMITIASTGFSTYGPVLMTLIHGTPPLVAGYTLAAVSIGWSVAAFTVSGLPERYDPAMIAFGLTLVTLSLCGLTYALPHGPVWLVAVFAAMEGVGFGTAYSFVVRRTRRLAPDDDVERLAAALPTVGRFGFALGASYSGILANAGGFSLAASRETLQSAGSALFLYALPIAVIALIAMVFFTRYKTRKRHTREALI